MLPIAVLEFGSLWMLGWLAAAGIPLALHLLHRRRQQEIPWAAVELLMQAIRQNSRTVRIEQWLLLLLRTVALILFAIALGRPFMRGTAATETVVAEPPKLWILVLDSSYSMGYRPQRQSLWELAQQRAVDLISQAQMGDAFVLIQLAEPSRAIIAQPSFEAARMVEAIQRLRPTDGGGDLASSLQLVRQAIEDAQQAAPEHEEVHVLFFSDMGRDTWQSALSGPERRSLQELSTRHNVRVESLAPEAPANVAITAFDADTPIVLRGRNVRCSATVQNFGNDEIKRLPVQFQSEGRTLHTEFVDCPPGDSRTVSADMQPPSSRYWHLSAAVGDDRLAVDNRRDLIISVRPQLRVVTLEEMAGAARLVNLSLSPLAEGTALDTTMAVESWNVNDFQARSLDDVDAVILVDIAELSPRAVVKLRSFVEAGGAVLALVGRQAQTTSWNRPSDSLGALLGFDLRQPSPSGDWRVDPLNYASPIAKPFANFPDAGLLTTPVFRYWQIAPRKSSDLRIDLGFTSGDPWLVRRPLGEGWAAALLSNPESGAATGTSAEETWNAIATWPSFVPIMQKTVETIVGGSEQALNLSVGQPLRGALPQPSSSVELSVRRPDGTTARWTVTPGAGGEPNAWSYASTDRAGVYQVSIGSSDSSGASSNLHPYAVNIVPTQSDMQSVPAVSLPLTEGTPTAESRRSVFSTSGTTEQRDRIARWCLLALLAVLGCESLLAWNLGRRLT